MIRIENHFILTTKKNPETPSLLLFFLVLKKKKKMVCCSCNCLHFTVGGVRTWSFLMGLLQLGTFVCHYYAKTPFTEITQILGDAPSQAQQCAVWTYLAFVVVLRLAFAANPMCRNVAQVSAIVHWIAFFPMTYLAIVNIFLRYETLSAIHLAGGAAIVAFSYLNAVIFYNYWMDRLTGEIRSTAVSVSRESSVASVAVAAPKLVAAKKLAPPPRAAAQKEEKEEKEASTPVARKSATPARKSTSASPKKKSATPKKSSSKSRAG